MNPTYIAIEGNIGVGKTTLASLLAKELNASLILEEFADNPFLHKFYENPAQYAFSLELSFMAERYKQQKEKIKQQDLFEQYYVADYMFSKSLLFAKMNLNEHEFNLFNKIYDIIQYPNLQPNLLIFLNASIDKLQQNIKTRNRQYEQSISNEYLLKIQESYIQFIKQHQIKTIFVDVTNADFLNNKTHLTALIKLINTKFEGTYYYSSLN